MTKNKVRELRHRKNWTQAKLAVLTGVNISQISLAERYNIRPSKNAQRLIAKALGVSIDYLWPKEVKEVC